MLNLTSYLECCSLFTPHLDRTTHHGVLHCTTVLNSSFYSLLNAALLTLSLQTLSKPSPFITLYTQFHNPLFFHLNHTNQKKPLPQTNFKFFISLKPNEPFTHITSKKITFSLFYPPTMSNEEVPIEEGRKKTKLNENLDSYRFLSEAHEKKYYRSILKRRITSEKHFDLKDSSFSCFTFIEKELQKRGWENFHSCIKNANKTWVREFYSNASSTVPEFKSMVRGVSLKLSGDVINSMLGLTAPPECWVENMRAKQLSAETYDMLLNALCKPGAGTQWVLEKENGKPKFYASRI